jgi:hypothetical protein
VEMSLGVEQSPIGATQRLLLCVAPMGLLLSGNISDHGLTPVAKIVSLASRALLGPHALHGRA